MADLSYGPQAWIRGHWRDRLDAIERNRDVLERLANDAAPSEAPAFERAPSAAASPPSPDGLELHHEPPTLRHGSPTTIELGFVAPGPSGISSVRLRYRPMDQSRTWLEREMEAVADRYVTVVPPDATSDPYPLAYSFVLEGSNGGAWRHPDLGENLAGRPYFVAVRGQS